MLNSVTRIALLGEVRKRLQTATQGTLVKMREDLDAQQARQVVSTRLKGLLK